MQRLIDLVESFKVYAVCSDCARMEAMDLAAIIEQFGGDRSVTWLRSQLRCADCGHRTEDLRIVYVGACEKTAGFGYRRNAPRKRPKR